MNIPYDQSAGSSHGVNACMSDRTLFAERDFNSATYTLFNVHIFPCVLCSSHSFAFNCTCTVQQTFAAMINRVQWNLHLSTINEGSKQNDIYKNNKQKIVQNIFRVP